LEGLGDSSGSLVGDGGRLWIFLWGWVLMRDVRWYCRGKLLYTSLGLCCGFELCGDFFRSHLLTGSRRRICISRDCDIKFPSWYRMTRSTTGAGIQSLLDVEDYEG